jgi:lysophospholipase L1-like esterase
VYLFLLQKEKIGMKSILCYGDSNTWGFVPGSYDIRERFDRNTRWTGRLQQLLDPAQFYVIEEGLNSRTTNLDYSYKPPGFRGTEFFLPILYTHAPLDLVIIMLGINDLKKEFNHRTSQQVTQGIKELIEIARSTDYGSDMKSPPPILIVSIPIPVETNLKDAKDMFEGAKERAEHLAHDLKVLVDQYDKNVYFVDAAPHVQLSPVDGIHFDKKAHEQFALLMNETIRKIFNLSS